MKQKFKTWLPLFPGFYSTIFEYDREEYDIDSYNEENNTDLSFDDFDFDYREYEQRVAVRFTDRLEKELKQYMEIGIVFENIYRPREYNFTNDSINVEIEVDLDVVLDKIRENKKSASEIIRNKHTSCSGFISFHSPDIDTWLDKSYIMADPAYRVGQLLETLCDIWIDRDDIYYWCDGEMWIDFTPKKQTTSI